MKLTKTFSYDNGAHFALLSEMAYKKSEKEFRKEIQNRGYNYDVKYFDIDGAQCYGLTDSDSIIFAFRGTEPDTFNDVQADLKVFPVKDGPEGLDARIHRGFKDEVDTLWKPITKWLKENGKNKQVYTCGHSLGGAMSGICASRIDGSICYNYGCPRIGTNKWGKLFNKNHTMYRFVNDRDIVPRIPPAWMRYKHVGDLFHINKDGNKITKNPGPWNQFKTGCMNMVKNPLRITQGVSDHDMSEYRRYIENWSKVVKEV